MHYEQESTFYAFMAKCPSDHVKSSDWYIDSSASQHFTHRRDCFIEYTPFTDSVIIGGGKEYTVIGKGNVQIQFGGRNLIFLNILHCAWHEAEFVVGQSNYASFSTTACRLQFAQV